MAVSNVLLVLSDFLREQKTRHHVRTYLQLSHRPPDIKHQGPSLTCCKKGQRLRPIYEFKYRRKGKG